MSIADPVDPKSRTIQQRLQPFTKTMTENKNFVLIAGFGLLAFVAFFGLVAFVGTFKTTPVVIPENERFRKVDGAEIRELHALYRKLLPIEKQFQLQRFGLPEITPAEISMSPTVLLLGPYSTGKTTFIKHMIGMDYPDIHIGPEPTTDKFTAVLYGKDNRTISGNVLVGLEELPFGSLGQFGYSFLNKFSAAVVSAPPLMKYHFIDTPGVLAGVKQSVQRGYSFPDVAAWFAAHADLILLFFDCAKLDISDEYRAVIDAITPYEDRISLVLNKADEMDQNALMRVYGSLTRSMANTFKSVENTHIYVGSFSDKPLSRPEHKVYFEKERTDLMSKFNRLTWNSSMRKISEMTARVRKIQAIVSTLTYLRSKAPYLWGKEAIQERLVSDLANIFKTVRETSKFDLLPSDFPNVNEFTVHLKRSDFTQFR